MGAEVFHGPVREGKGWFHLAMGTRRNWCDPGCASREAVVWITELEEVMGVDCIELLYEILIVIGSSHTGN